MSLKRNILDLRKRKEIVLQGGGEDAIKKQAAMGKLTARERIEGILDKGSFHEYDMFVEHQSKDFDMDKKVLHGDGVVIGTGTVYGEPVAIYAQDFTVAGGSLGLMHARKITKIMDHAIKMRMPIIGIIMVLNCGIGLLTPPVGAVLFIGSAVAKRPMEKVVKATLPFYLCMFIALLLLTYVPDISLAIPKLLGGYVSPITNPLGPVFIH